MTTTISPSPPSAAPSPASTRAVRRAWLALTAAFVIFVMLLTSAGASAYLYRRGAMQEREGWLVTSGEVLVQPKNETRFKQVRSGEPLREGDTVKTPGGIQAQLKFFDGSALTLAEGSQVQIDELRATRFVAAEKRIALTQRQGWSRLMAPPTADYAIGNFVMRLDSVEIASDRQRGQDLDLSFEVRPTVWQAGEGAPGGPVAATVAVRARHHGARRAAGGGDDADRRICPQRRLPRVGAAGRARDLADLLAGDARSGW
jgi:preprotein translocase subunit YajC